VIIRTDSTVLAFFQAPVKSSDSSRQWGSNWKEEMPPKALQQLNQLEQQLDKLRREKDQKQCQLDSLEQVGLYFVSRYS
jgi:hypothetical protein